MIQPVVEFFADRNNREPNRAYQGDCHAYQSCGQPNCLRGFLAKNSIRWTLFDPSLSLKRPAPASER
jgi:hypothetical protein